MNNINLKIVMSVWENLHQHSDHCVYDTKNKLLTTLCDECIYKGTKWTEKDVHWKYKCSPYKILNILEIED